MSKKSKYITFTVGNNKQGKTAFSESLIKQAEAQGKTVVVFKPSKKSYSANTWNVPEELLNRPIPQFNGLHLPEITPFNSEKTSEKWPKFPYIEIPSKKAMNPPWHEDC